MHLLYTLGRLDLDTHGLWNGTNILSLYSEVDKAILGMLTVICYSGLIVNIHHITSRASLVM